MFANNNLGVLNFAFPDVCEIITPAGTIPTPLVNLAFSTTHIPSVYNVLIGCGLSENLMTSGTISNGDEAGLALGAASGTIIGPDRPVLGSFCTFFGTAPATRLTTMNIQNSTNAVGFSLTPAQVCVLLLG